MPKHADRRLLVHKRIVFWALAIGTSSMVLFRGLVEAGLAPGGSLRLRGVPLEYLFLAWFFAAVALAAYSARGGDRMRAQASLLELALSIVGVAGVIYVVQAMVRADLLQTAAWTYWIGGAAIVAIFLSSAIAPRDAFDVAPRIVFTHLRQLVCRPATWLCTVAAVAVVGIAPRSMEVPEGGASFRRWYSRQPHATMPSEWQVRPVTLIAVTDYQCPSCRLVEERYREVIRQAEDEYGERFIFVRRDFPLEAECNPVVAARGKGGNHFAACEAAAAVRLAREVSDRLEQAVVDWLWTNQRRLDRQTVLEVAQQEFQLELASRYDSLLPSIAAEAAAAGRASVAATPVYFLNGRRLPVVSARGLAAAIDLEISRTASMSSSTAR